MTKRLWILAALILVLSVISIPLVSAAPAWKKSTTTTPTATGTTTAPTANIAPQITSISLEPSPASVDGKLKCLATPFDANGDTVKITYLWSSTGRCDMSKVTSSIIDLSASDCDKEGDVITCIATPNDGKVNGVPSQQSVTISSKGFNWEMLGVILAVIGALVGWLISRRVRGKTAKYMSEIDRVYRSSNTSTNKCEAKLVGIRDQIEDDFKKGKINDQSLALLESRIDKYTRELRSGIVDRTTGIPTDLNKKIKHMLSDGVITKEEYAHFEEIVKKENMGASDKEEIRNLMKKWKDEDKR